MVRLTRRGALMGIGGSVVVAATAGTCSADRPRESRSPTRGPGRWTTFGSIALLGWTEHTHTTDTSVHGPGQHEGAGQQHLGGGPHLIWPQIVVIAVEIHNGLDRALLFSPGQFRLRVGPGGPSVAPYDTEGWAEGLAAGSTRTTWVSFLAPRDAADLAVEFTEAGAAQTVSTVLRSSAVHVSRGSRAVGS